MGGEICRKMCSILPKELDPTIIHADEERGYKDGGCHGVAVTAGVLSDIRLFCSGAFCV